MEYEQNTKRGQYVSGLYSSSRTKRNHATLIEEKVEVAENTYNYDKNVYIYDIELGDDEEIGDLKVSIELSLNTPNAVTTTAEVDIINTQRTSAAIQIITEAINVPEGGGSGVAPSQARIDQLIQEITDDYYILETQRLKESITEFQRLTTLLRQRTNALVTEYINSRDVAINAAYEAEKNRIVQAVSNFIAENGPKRRALIQTMSRLVNEGFREENPVYDTDILNPTVYGNITSYQDNNLLATKNQNAPFKRGGYPDGMRKPPKRNTDVGRITNLTRSASVVSHKRFDMSNYYIIMADYPYNYATESNPDVGMFNRPIFDPNLKRFYVPNESDSGEGQFIETNAISATSIGTYDLEIPTKRSDLLNELTTLHADIRVGHRNGQMKRLYIRNEVLAFHANNIYRSFYEYMGTTIDNVNPVIPAFNEHDLNYFEKNAIFFMPHDIYLSSFLKISHYVYGSYRNSDKGPNTDSMTLEQYIDLMTDVPFFSKLSNEQAHLSRIRSLSDSRRERFLLFTLELVKIWDKFRQEKIDPLLVVQFMMLTRRFPEVAESSRILTEHTTPMLIFIMIIRLYNAGSTVFPNLDTIVITAVDHVLSKRDPSLYKGKQYVELLNRLCEYFEEYGRGSMIPYDKRGTDPDVNDTGHEFSSISYSDNVYQILIYINEIFIINPKYVPRWMNDTYSSTFSKPNPYKYTDIYPRNSQTFTFDQDNVPQIQLAVDNNFKISPLSDSMILNVEPGFVRQRPLGTPRIMNVNVTGPSLTTENSASSAFVERENFPADVFGTSKKEYVPVNEMTQVMSNKVATDNILTNTGTDIMKNQAANIISEAIRKMISIKVIVNGLAPYYLTGPEITTLLGYNTGFGINDVKIYTKGKCLVKYWTRIGFVTDFDDKHLSNIDFCDCGSTQIEITLNPSAFSLNGVTVDTVKTDLVYKRRKYLTNPQDDDPIPLQKMTIPWISQFRVIGDPTYMSLNDLLARVGDNKPAFLKKIVLKHDENAKNGQMSMYDYFDKKIIVDNCIITKNYSKSTDKYGANRLNIPELSFSGPFVDKTDDVLIQFNRNELTESFPGGTETISVACLSEILVTVASKKKHGSKTVTNISDVAENPQRYY